MKIIIVKPIGELSEYCRQYFKGESGSVYAKQEDSPGVFNWYTTTKKSWEPEIPLSSVIFLEVESSLPVATMADISRYGFLAIEWSLCHGGVDAATAIAEAFNDLFKTGNKVHLNPVNSSEIINARKVVNRLLEIFAFHPALSELDLKLKQS